MDELLDDLLASMQEGVFNNKEELQSVIDSDGIEALYELTDKTAFPDMEEYVKYFSPLKKKTKPYYLLLLQRKIRNQILQHQQWSLLDLRILQE